MTGMEALNCKNCGGQIDPRTHKCRYCGTYYKEKEFPKIRTITVDRVEARELVGKCMIDGYDYLHGAEVATRMAKAEIVAQIAEALEPYVEWEVQDDIATLETVVRGRVRILPPRR